MIKNENIVEKAIAFAAEAYQGKVNGIDKSPYILKAMETLVTMSCIDSIDKDLMAASVLYHITENSDTTFDDVEKEFGARIKNVLVSATPPAGSIALSLSEEFDSELWRENKESEIDYFKRLPLKIKMLVLADKTAEVKILNRYYSYYRDGLWDKLEPGNPGLLAWYYYEISDILYEFEEYDAFSEYNQLIARTFVKYR